MKTIAIAIAMLVAACAAEPDTGESTSDITREQHNNQFAWCSSSNTADCSLPAPPGINQCFTTCGITYDPIARATVPPGQRAGCGFKAVGNLEFEYNSNTGGVLKCYRP